MSDLADLLKQASDMNICVQVTKSDTPGRYSIMGNKLGEASITTGGDGQIYSIREPVRSVGRSFKDEDGKFEFHLTRMLKEILSAYREKPNPGGRPVLSLPAINPRGSQRPHERN